MDFLTAFPEIGNGISCCVRCMLFALLGILAEGSEATGTPIDMRIYDELSFA